MSGPSQLVVARGPRASETWLLAQLAAHAEAVRQDPALLALPVRVVVPSASLRQHLCARLVGSPPGAVVGVEVHTLFGLAAAVLERAGEAPPQGHALFPVLVRRAAAGEALLRAAFSPLQDGWGALVATVRDLLDAGFQEAHAEAVDERLAELAGDPAVERARAVVRVAAAVDRESRRLGLGRREAVLQRATHLVRTDRERLLPARAVFVHGFAEATGLAADLLEALVTRCPTTVVVDEPPDPAAPSQVDAGAVFTRRLRERLGRHLLEDVAGVEAPPPELRLRRAPTVDDEVRQVAASVRVLLDAGVRPEGIGVVARVLDPFTVALERHFGRLGIPYACPGGRGSPTPAGRRLAAIAEVLRHGVDASVDAWLVAEDLAGEALVDLGVGLRACGAARLGEVADLPVDELLAGEESLPLPVRQGIAAAEEGDDAMPQVRHRRLARQRLLAAVARAAALRGQLAAWPAAADVATHRAWLVTLGGGCLGSSPWTGSPGGEELSEALRTLEGDIPAGLRLAREEFVELVLAELAEAGRAPLGGRGGGVQVLGVTEARGRTFAHLFLLGLGRDMFPRVVREDPLVPDRLRAALAVVLPDLNLKLGGFDEERYLFAQLLSASPQVTLSWHATSDGGAPVGESPLLARVRGWVSEVAGEDAPGAEVGPATALEHAIAAGLAGDRQGFVELLALARGEADPDGVVAPEELARARQEVLDELDPDLAVPAGRQRWREVGPFFGFVGRVTAGDPRGELAATVAASMVGCPWATFLERVLRLEEPPDPLAAVPAVDARSVGAVVHAVLEAMCRLAAPHLAAELAAADGASPVAVPWPPVEALEVLLAREAARVARGAGLLWPGWHALLQERARPFLEAAREFDWGSGVLEGVCGVEVSGAVVVRGWEGEQVVLRFRADRVDLRDATLVLTDYKTGNPPRLGGAKARTGDIVKGIVGGALLQGAAYAVAMPGRALGRYLFLRPELAEREEREVVLSAGDDGVREALEDTVATAAAAWREGAFFPRLLEPGEDREPRRCGGCAYKAACLRGDSGARRRLREWASGSAGAAGAGTAERAALALWWLPRARKNEPAGEGA